MSGLAVVAGELAVAAGGPGFDVFTFPDFAHGEMRDRLGEVGPVGQLLDALTADAEVGPDLCRAHDFIHDGQHSAKTTCDLTSTASPDTPDQITLVKSQLGKAKERGGGADMPQRRISIGRAELDRRPHVLYRFFDRTDVLLYVGISVDLQFRMKSHGTDKSWWPEVASMTVERFPDRKSALRAEEAAIKAEHPLHNDQHNTFVYLDDSTTSLCPGGTTACNCPSGCASFHGKRKSCAGREDFAWGVLGTISNLVGRNVEPSAIAYAESEVMIDPDESEWGDESPVGIAASYAINEMGAEFQNLVRWSQKLLDALPASCSQPARNAADHDLACSGNENPSQAERIAVQFRHIVHALHQRCD